MFQPPSAGLLASPIIPPTDADTHIHSRVSLPHPSHTPRDWPLSLKLREGKHPAQQCTEGTSNMGLDPRTPLPEMESFYKVGARPGRSLQETQDEYLLGIVQPGFMSYLLPWPLPSLQPQASPPHHSRVVPSCSVNGGTEQPMANRFGGKIKFVITLWQQCHGSCRPASCCSDLA